MKKLITVVSPCFNEEVGIRKCYESVTKLFNDELREYDLEYIFCDNGSNDETVRILREIANKDKRVKVIVNSRNFGVLENTFNGVVSSSGDAVLLFLPIDMQDPPELLPRFVEHWESGYQIVYGVRASREEGITIASLRKLYYQLLSRITYVDYPPNVGDFQLVDKRVIEELRRVDDAYPFLRMMTFDTGFDALGVKYTWRKREYGKSHLSIFHLFDLGLRGIVSHSVLPLRLCLFIGLIVAVGSLIYALYVAILIAFGGPETIRGIPTIIVAIFFFAGVQLFFLGFIGEYLAAIYRQVRKKPLVVEKERINF